MARPPGGTRRSDLQPRPSPDDLAFQRAFETVSLGADEFDHAAHLRIAWTYLCEDQPQEAADRMRRGLLALLERLGAGADKYHETMTRAWIDAVAHRMRQGEACESFERFIAQWPELGDSRMLLDHYSSERLNSDQARAAYLSPDLEDIAGGKGASRR